MCFVLCSLRFEIWVLVIGEWLLMRIGKCAFLVLVW